MRFLKVVLLVLLSKMSFCQFAPPAGQTGTTAMYKDSSAFIAWVTGCTIIRGYQDISDTSLGFASFGDSTSAFGIAGTTGIVSLGDGGSAILTFAQPITNEAGYDFAVFENAFSDTFLELAFVEVSSDGINYYRFPATSNTQDTLQIDGFGSVDASFINNLAGKYRALYGTPFDLQELSSQAGLDITHVTHVKIVDAVGCIQPAYATHDMNGKKLNELWSTPFPSSGFDLDAVGVIHNLPPASVNEFLNEIGFNIFPNPVINSGEIQFSIKEFKNIEIIITDLTGRKLKTLFKETNVIANHSIQINTADFNSGMYLIQMAVGGKIQTKKIIIVHHD